MTEGLSTSDENKKPKTSTRRVFLRNAVMAAGAAIFHTNTRAQETNTTPIELVRPPIEKKSLQRTAYDNRENYEKYAASFGQQYKNGKPVEKKDLTDKQIREMGEKMKEAFKNADEQREWMADIVYSPEYEKRCIAEGLTPEQIKKRRDIVLNNEPVMADPFHSLPPEDTGLYNEDTGECVVNLEKISKTEPVPAVCHELTHALTGMEKNMSDTAKNMYLKAFIPNLKETRYYLPTNYLKNAHLERPSELDARKTEFEYELGKLGIWTYGETFTDEHLKKVLSHMQETFSLTGKNKLSVASEDFLLYLGAKKNEDLFIKLMNTLA